MLNGTSNPDENTGVDGDFYINTTSNEFFGPKSEGEWGEPTQLKGADGKTVLNGASNPDENTGVDGDFYINTTDNKIFGPKASGVWPEGVSLLGISSIGTISSTSIANGASITAGELILAPASATYPGIVDTTTQTFAGAKTFTANLNVNGITVGKGESENSIVINATGNPLSGDTTSGFYVKPIQSGGGTANILSYNSNSGEIVFREGELPYLRRDVDSVAIGNGAGAHTQGQYSIAIGREAGMWLQQDRSVAIGNNAGNFNQRAGAIAIGDSAAYYQQGANAIAIGRNAVGENQPANSIILNASGSALVATTEGFFVKPIREESTTMPAYLLTYDDITGEIKHSSYFQDYFFSNTKFDEIKTNSINTGSLVMTSDKRLKTNIVGLNNSLDAIKKLNPVSYKKKDSIASTQYKQEEMGFIAQEIQKVLPMVVKEGADKDKILSVNYISLIPLLTKAIQEQQTLIDAETKSKDEMKKQLDEQKKTMQQQQKQIDELKKLIEQVLNKK